FLLPPPAPPAPHTLSLHDALPISGALSRYRGTPRLRRGAPSIGGFGGPFRGPQYHDPRVAIAACIRRRPSLISASLVAYESLTRSEEHTSELQSRFDLVCRLLLEK